MTTATVLIVEDHDANRKLLGVLLGRLGYRVLDAADGQSGLALANEHLPDLVLMDIQLPKLDGFAAANALKGQERTRHIPVVIMTAFALKAEEERWMSSGAEAFLAKPVRLQDLTATIKRLLPEKGTAP